MRKLARTEFADARHCGLIADIYPDDALPDTPTDRYTDTIQVLTRKSRSCMASFSI
jgi:hypothetical protein